MRKIPFILACACLAIPAAAQNAQPWRIGAVASSSARLIDVNSATLPDSNNSRVDLGLGFGAEVGRAWQFHPKASVVAMVRAISAPVKTHVGGASWNPGRALILEAGAKVQRVVSARVELFGGANLAHWSGPDRTAPFADANSMLFATEAGLSTRMGDGPWHLDLGANITRFPGDDARNVSTGFAWRWMAGLRRDR